LIAASLPPYYTALPNSFIEDFVRLPTSPTPYTVLQPYNEDVSAGKNDPLYFAHSYPTKVPPRAIIPYILHYTKPGDVVLDGFCGTGMTGVAAQLCGQLDGAVNPPGMPGPRRAILIDLSPAATFIAAVTNSIASLAPHLDGIQRIVEQVEQAHLTLLETNHTGWLRGLSDNPLWG